MSKTILFAAGVKLINANHSFNEYSKKTNPIIIGDNVWLGANVIILPGVEIIVL